MKNQSRIITVQKGLQFLKEKYYLAVQTVKAMKELEGKKNPG